MAEKGASEESNYARRIKQPVSVPFIWEEKPGTPKKDWKPATPTVRPPPPPLPVKFVASVPFVWEEKPGKPLPYFPAKAIIPPPPPPKKLIDGGCGSCGDKSGSEDSEEYKIFEPELEACSFETDGSFCSVPGAASDSGSSTSSYATGASSLVGAAFLECMFPLLSPERSSPVKLQSGFPEKSASEGAARGDFDSESSCSGGARRLPTLGELIMMSRRRSYIRKVAQMRRQNLYMGSRRKGAGCFMFGFNGRIEEVQRKWKRQLQLKLL